MGPHVGDPRAGGGVRKRRQLTIAEAPHSSELERYLGRRRDADGKLEPKPKPRPRRSVSASVFGRTLIETQAMIDERDWARCETRHLVALHELMHLKTYGVSAEMSASERHTAGFRMSAFVKRAFDGANIEAVAYFRWMWTQEIGKEKWCRENNIARHRSIGLGLAISGEMLREYRIAGRRARQSRG